MALTSQLQRAGFPLTLELDAAGLPKRSWVTVKSLGWGHLDDPVLAFNVLGDRSVTGIQTVVNAVAGFVGCDYGRVRAWVPPRTPRLGAAVRF